MAGLWQEIVVHHDAWQIFFGGCKMLATSAKLFPPTTTQLRNNATFNSL